MKRLGLVALAAVGLAAILGWRALDREESEVPWARVERQDLVVGVEVTGTLGAIDSVELGPPQIQDVWNFKISFLAPEGAEVKPGQPVLGFDTSDLENRLLEKQGERDAAEKELEKKLVELKRRRGEDEMRLAEAEAKARRGRLRVDVPADLVTAKELAGSREDLALAEREADYLSRRLALQDGEAGAEIAALRNRRDRAAAGVREAEAAIAQMTVRAPRAGTVILLSDARREREKKKIGDAAWRGEKVLQIPNLRRMRADGEIDEADAGRVAAGQRVTLRLDAHPDLLFTGRVQALRGAVQARSPTDPVKVVEVELSLDRTDPQRMRPGMRFLGTVELDRVPRALVLPVAAVLNRPGGPVVLLRTRWGTREVRPRFGRRNERWVEVLEGLAEGDEVALRDPRGVVR